MYKLSGNTPVLVRISNLWLLELCDTIVEVLPDTFECDNIYTFTVTLLIFTPFRLEFNQVHKECHRTVENTVNTLQMRITVSHCTVKICSKLYYIETARHSEPKVKSRRGII